MKVDLFDWAIGTAIISSILFFILSIFTTNDLYWWLLLVLLALVSIITFSRGNDQQFSPFKSGGVIGLVVFVSMLVVGDKANRILDFVSLAGIFIGTFIIAGIIGKISAKKNEYQMPNNQ